MGDHTGFNILERHIAAHGRHVIYQRNSIFSKYFFGLFDRLIRLLWSPPAYYKSEAIFHEIYFIFFSFFQKTKVLHLNSEDTAWLTVKYISDCTYCVIHQPISWYKSANGGFFSLVRNVVCLDPQSQKYLYQEKNVLLLAHPVDKIFFTNSIEKRVVKRGDGLNIIIVGTHRRDWEGYIRVIKFLSDYFCCTIRVVGDERKMPKTFLNFLSNYIFVISKGLSERELRDAYDKSDVCLMFCIESTANNCLLEAMSMGLKIIVNDCRSFFYYLDGYSEYYVYKSDDNSIINFLVENNKRGIAKNLISPQEAALYIDKFLSTI